MLGCGQENPPDALPEAAPAAAVLRLESSGVAKAGGVASVELAGPKAASSSMNSTAGLLRRRDGYWDLAYYLPAGPMKLRDADLYEVVPGGGFISTSGALLHPGSDLKFRVPQVDPGAYRVVVEAFINRSDGEPTRVSGPLLIG